MPERCHVAKVWCVIGRAEYMTTCKAVAGEVVYSQKELLEHSS